MVAIDGVGFDWSYMADDKVPTNMALMAFLDSKPKVEGYGPKTSNNVSENISNMIKESPDTPLVKELVSEDKLDSKDVYLVKEHKFNHFSVSQICDKKNSVIFTDTEYVDLYPDFKLLDES
nr:ribonuclease H-like domain-containing protein [Tanacetum cinerariifolium]